MLDRVYLTRAEFSLQNRSMQSFLVETEMIPNRSDIVGRWSEDLGHTDDLSRDTVLEFYADGVMRIVSGNDCIVGHWDCPTAGRLTMHSEDGHRFGPFCISIEQRELPLGVFDVLETDGSLLPFGRRRFTRVVNDNEPGDAAQPRNQAI